MDKIAIFVCNSKLFYIVLTRIHFTVSRSASIGYYKEELTSINDFRKRRTSTCFHISNIALETILKQQLLWIQDCTDRRWLFKAMRWILMRSNWNRNKNGQDSFVFLTRYGKAAARGKCSPILYRQAFSYALHVPLCQRFSVGLAITYRIPGLL